FSPLFPSSPSSPLFPSSPSSPLFPSSSSSPLFPSSPFSPLFPSSPSSPLFPSSPSSPLFPSSSSSPLSSPSPGSSSTSFTITVRVTVASFPASFNTVYVISYSPGSFVSTSPEISILSDTSPSTSSSAVAPGSSYVSPT